MATPTNGTGNLAEEFEDSFKCLMQVLTKEDEHFNTLEKDDTRVDIEQACIKFLDIARQLEVFFLQKRFLLSALKPELVIKEEINELKLELARKDDLIKRHHEKIGMWQNLLNEVNCQVGIIGMADVGRSSGSAMPPRASSGPSPSVISAMQQQLQQQQQMQQQQIQMSAAMSTGPAPPMMSPQQAMFMQQQSMGQRMPNYQGPIMPNQGPGMMTTGPSGMIPSQGPGIIPNQGAGMMTGQGPGMMTGPLAYLEKTTSNIGMPDGRR